MKNEGEMTQEEIRAIIKQHEEQFGLSSEEFLQQWRDGTFPDTFEAMDWLILFRTIGTEASGDDSCSMKGVGEQCG